MTKKLPLVVVLGATACGKSKLAIEIACRFGGEVISADSMQVYRGLDIATNKVTEKELEMAKHHMMSFVDPSQNYSVVDFRNRSLGIIDSLHRKNTLPIVVGGTNYYIESLLWKSFLLGETSTEMSSDDSDKVNGEEKNDSEQEDFETTREDTLLDSEANMFGKLPQDLIHSDQDLSNPDEFFKKTIYPTSFPNVAGERLWHILEQVDPETAHQVHPNNRRGIIRFLQIIQTKGRKYSEILNDLNKSSQEGKSSLGGPLRFENTCVLWLNCENETLHRVLDERIDQMLDRGLLKELQNFHQTYNKHRVFDNKDSNYEWGIFQTIGFKEFHDYLMLDPELRDTENGNKILKKSIEDMKISTRQYVRRQIKWIRSRFLRYGIRDLPDVFKLTTTFDEEDWRKQVREPAFEIVESFIKGQPLNDELLTLKPESNKEFVPYGPGKLHCDACDRTLIGNNHIRDHLKSKRHYKNLTNLKRKRQKLVHEIETKLKAQDDI